MDSLNRDKKKLQGILAGVYGQREKKHVGDAWQADVMRSIRTMPASNIELDPLFSLEQVVWRFAPVACVLIVALTVIIGAMDFTPNYGLAEAYMENSMDMLFAMTVGSE